MLLRPCCRFWQQCCRFGNNVERNFVLLTKSKLSTKSTNLSNGRNFTINSFDIDACCFNTVAAADGASTLATMSKQQETLSKKRSTLSKQYSTLLSQTATMSNVYRKISSFRQCRMLLRHWCRFLQQCCRFWQQCQTKFRPFDKFETFNKGDDFVERK